jgi:AcrR family transcriptional regulator
MARSRPPDRLRHIVDAATRVFLAKGFKRTLMSDVAAELELSPGTLYRYVESKEALFHLCVLPDQPLPDTPPPVATPPLDETLDAIRVQLAPLFLERITAAREAPSADAVGELRGILDELYEKIEANHVVLALVERSADDVPGLQDLFYVDGRRILTDDLTDHLHRRMADGGLRRVDDPRATALLLREGISWFAYHRHFDFDGRDLDGAHLPEVVIDLLVEGLAPR